MNENRSDITLAEIGVVIPTLNASRYLPSLLNGLAMQQIEREQILFIDSASDDDTCNVCRDFGARVVKIDRADFNHGGTRARAVEMLPDAKAIVMMTHDAIATDKNTLSNLISAFESPRVGIAYGRQLPRPSAKAVETFARLYNYPGTSERRGMQDAARLGVKTTFCSNSFAAYRRSAYEEVQGFPNDAFFAEDQITAGKMLLAGWEIAYRADATVYHSHAYSMKEEFNRYFDVGVFHARNSWLREEFGSAEGEGFRFLKAEAKYLARHDPLSVPSALVRTIAKYLGYRLGRAEHRMPSSLKAKFSMQPFYWRRKNSNA